ncbi:MAG: M15 family metallopeptidase [Rikenellaceae bacterium]
MNQKQIYISLLFSLLHLIVYAQNMDATDYETLSKWHVTKEVSQQSVEEFGIENCFGEHIIDDHIFARIKCLSYKENCTVSLNELRYIRLLHYGTNGEIRVGEMICNRAISSEIISIFKALYDAKYRIERIQLIDEFGADDQLSMANNNSSSFNFRYISGTTKLSKHSLGLAVDINPLYNPYVRTIGGRMVVEPTEAKEYADRKKDFAYKIDQNDLCYKLFISHGFTWGGNWNSSKDYQHFEKNL